MALQSSSKKFSVRAPVLSVGGPDSGADIIDLGTRPLDVAKESEVACFDLTCGMAAKIPVNVKENLKFARPFYVENHSNELKDVTSQVRRLASTIFESQT